MHSFDGAESCELVGSRLPHSHHISMKHGKAFGLYRDDGLGVIKATAREVEMIKRSMLDFQQLYGLKVTIEASKKIVNFRKVPAILEAQQRSPLRP